MQRLYRVLLVGLVSCSAARAGEWQTYTYPDPGFAIQFPAVPEVETTKIRNAVGVTVPVTRYVVRQDGVEYTLSIFNYSSTNADSLSTIGEAARSFRAKGKVSADAGARVDGSSGRQLTLTESDGSRSDVAIFFVDHHLYTAVGRALPPEAADRSRDTVHFQQSLQFPRDDSGFFGLFGGRTKTSTAANAATSSASDVSAGGATAGSPGSAAARPRTGAIPHADAACAGKSPGDLVQLDTPAGPVAATCTLIARPIPSDSTPSAAPPN